MAAYPSPQLKPGEIRLLELRPALLRTCGIECRLSIARLDQRPKYEALSYTWGPSKEKMSIHLSSRPHFVVTDNLWYALRRLRHLTRPRTLWIDALCIDQSSLEERASQVMMMHDVYAFAKRVVVWLGETSRPKLPSFAAACKADPRSLPHITPIENFKASKLLLYVRRYMEVFQALRQSDALDAVICGTETLWWERAWVNQEVLIARDVVVCFGSHVISWDLFESRHTTSVSHCERELPELLDRKKAEFFAKLSFLNITRDGIVEGERSLLDLALVMMNSTATDPRDQVYSMRGLLHPEHRDRVTVDYTIPAWQTYAAATYSTMVYEGNLEALKFVRICNDRMPELPSWAIDFRPFSFIMPRTRRNSDFDERISVFAQWLNFSRPEAGVPNAKNDSEEFASIGAGSRHLNVSGRIIDRVEDFCIGRRDHYLRARERRYVPAHIWRPAFTALRQEIQDLARRRFEKSGDLQNGSTPADILAEIDAAAVASESERSGDTIDMLCRLWHKAYEWQVVLGDTQLNNIRSHCNDTWDYCTGMSSAAAIFGSSNGRWGIGTSTMRQGDLVAIITGARLPVILRPCSGAQTMEFKGFAYLWPIIDDDAEPVDIRFLWRGSPAAQREITIA